LGDFTAHDRTSDAGETLGGFDLSKNGQALEAVFRHTSDCIKLLDLDGRVLRWNSSCEDFYGWRSSEVLGEVLPNVPEDLRLRTLRDIRAVAAEGRVVEREAEHQRADGSRMMVQIVLIPMYDDDDDVSGVLSLANGVAQDNRLERQRENFIAAVSRELRDPLTAARGFAHLLQRHEIANNAERRDKAVASLADRLDSAVIVLDDLMLVSAMRHGPMVLDIKPVDLGALMGEVASGLGGSAKRLLLDFDTSVRFIPADARRLQRCIEILATAALASAPLGHSVGVSVYPSGQEVVVEIGASGERVAGVERDHVFERFYSSDSGGDDVPDMGVALYLARAVAEAHGGSLAVLDAQSGGNAFFLRLPMGTNGHPRGDS
jgi:PAS domain S-box-containing protein